VNDRILVRRIAVFAHHGMLPEEEKVGQRFYVSLDVRLDLAGAGRDDDLEQSVSYVDLTETAVRIATERRFRTIEALADAIADALLAGFPRLAVVSVLVDKPGAPVPAILDGVAVEVTRTRDG
jgi:7,8-dihydroneopterin aldolase/epimerase/oxygenase